MSDLNILPDPVETTDPAVSFGETNVVRFSKRLMEWMALLFPVGAGSWTTYTPTTNITLGTGGSITGRYTRIGKTLRGRVDFTLGTGFSFPADPQIGFPMAALSSRVDASGTCRPSSGSEYVLTGMSLNASSFRPRSPGTSGLLSSLSASIPAAWAAGGWGWLEFEYEIP